MVKNYFKIAWRKLLANKASTVVNIAGLSLGIACSILIFSIVSYHLSFDQFHAHSSRIYRIVTDFHSEGVGHTQGIQAPAAKAFRDDYTFAEKLTRIYTYGGMNIGVQNDPTKKFRDNVTFAEPDFFSIFNFPLLIGQAGRVISEPRTVVITQRIALKYFGTEDAMGKILDLGENHYFKITGILKDLPSNTDFRSEIYASYASINDFDSKVDTYWGGVYAELECYVLLKPGISYQDVERQFPEFNKKHFSGNDVKMFAYKLQPLADIHFNPDYSAVIEKKKLWALGIIGLFLIVTACVNFINLSTAQAINRSKEVGVRKVLGGLRSQLFWQFIAETILITLSAAGIGLLMAFAALPTINKLFNTQISTNLFYNIPLVVFLLSVSGVVIFLAGSYPAVIMSRFKPVIALKSRAQGNYAGSFSLRKVLVIIQFTISQILIISAVVIAGQIRYSTKSDLGFDKNAVVMVPLGSDSLSKMHTLKTRLEQIPDVKSISFCFQPPASEMNNYTSARFGNRSQDEPFGLNTKDADEGYVPTFGLKIIAGRNIFHSDSTREFVVNETFVKKLGLQSPEQVIGQRLMTSHGKRNGIIVGVMRDFYNLSFHSDIAPICIRSDHESYNSCAIKLNIGSGRQTLATIEKIWNETYPQGLYFYDFVDDSIARFYTLDATMLEMIEIFAAIAVLIGCLGLYGLVSFMAIQKTKEVGVRKVLGASFASILWLFGREFTRLIILAFLIAAPVGWWIMNNYLQDYKYKISLNVGVFGIAVGATFLLSALTVSYQSFKAASANPTKSLRSE
jgi:putative ABC transport system permease protein